MYRLGFFTFLLLAPALQAAQPEIRAILLNPAIEGVLEQIWADTPQDCLPNDAEERRLRDTAVSATAPAQQLERLEAWSVAYPNSPTCEAYRLWLTTLAQGRAGHAEQAADLGQGLLHYLPDSLERLFTLAWLAPGRESASKSELREIGAAAASLLNRLASSQFRPAPADGLTATEIRDAIELTARVALGSVAVANRDAAEAQMQFRQARRIMPESAYLSYKLGNALLGLGDPSQNSEALRAFAFAAEHTGTGALPEEDRLVVRGYLQKVWSNYSGGKPYEELLQAVRDETVISPSAEILAARAKIRIHYSRRPAPAFPQPYWKSYLYDPNQPLRTVFYDLWSVLRDPENGDAIWEEFQGNLSPRMNLMVIRTEPAERPQTVHLGAGNKTLVLLRLAAPLADAIPQGRSVVFEGVAESFQREPFLLTLGEGSILD